MTLELRPRLLRRTLALAGRGLKIVGRSVMSTALAETVCAIVGAPRVTFVDLADHVGNRDGEILPELAVCDGRLLSSFAPPDFELLLRRATLSWDR